MKKTFKKLSLMLVFASALSFAQTDCIQLPPHLDKLVGNPIRTDQFDWNSDRKMNDVRMISYLNSFNDSFNKYSAGGEVPSSYVEQIDRLDVKYSTLVNELISKSNDFITFRENILYKIKDSKDATEIEALILMDYSAQIVEHSGLHRQSTSALSWECISSTIGVSSSSVMMDPSLSTDTIGNPSGGIAGGGCTPQFPFPRPKGCN